VKLEQKQKEKVRKRNRRRQMNTTERKENFKKIEDEKKRN
jgi:hypothetical protein